MYLRRVCFVVLLLIGSTPYAGGINNPGNIVKSNTTWIGQKVCTGRFACFVTRTAGLRALVVNLRTYRHHHKLTTITQIITRWAPQHENDTRSYITFVSNNVGVAPDSTVRFTGGTLYKIVVSIIKMEQGYVDYSPKEIQNMIDKVFKL